LTGIIGADERHCRSHEAYLAFLAQLSQSLLTPMIAIVTVYIAWQQWRANELKLRLEQYDRRLRVYQEVVNIIGLIQASPNQVQLDDLMKFRTATAEGDFLFGPEVPAYIEEIYSHGVNLEAVVFQYRDSMPPPDDHQRVVQERQTEVQWFLKQRSVAKEKFKKYLDISR
jgi:hypothetical protein